MRLVVAIALAGCGDNRELDTVDAQPPRADAMPDAMPDAARPVRIDGNVDFGGGLAGVTMTLLGTSETTVTDADGNWHFDVPDGSRAIVRAEATNRPELLPMIRGIVAADHLRPRIFYLAGPPDVDAATSLGKTFDPAKAVVEVDFRNAQIAGYSASVTAGGALAPDYGIAYDSNGDPVLSTSTVSGGDGSTLLLANLPVTSGASFMAFVPVAATLPCQVRDADPLPLLAGTVTWVDYECGNATD